MKEKKVRKPLVERNFIPFPLTWLKFPHNKIPENFNYGSIYKHLITTSVLQEPTNNNILSAGDKENIDVDYSRSKPLARGKQYFDSGHVQNIVDAVTEKESYYCAKAHVLASFRQQYYNVNIMLHSVTADVVDAKCQCKASTMGRCSHVAALLYALLDFVMTVKSSNACTSKLCEWNRGRQKKSPLIADENQYKSKKNLSQKKAFDPRPAMSVENSLKRNQNFVENLKVESSSCQSVTMWELLSNPDNNNSLQYTHAQESEDKIQEFPDFRNNVEMEPVVSASYDDYEMNNVQRTCDEIQEVPECSNFESLKDATVHDVYELLPSRRLEVQEMVKTLYKNLSFCAIGSQEITTAQSSSEEWVQLRKLLITASCLKTFTLPKNDKQLYNLIERHLWKKTAIRSVALEYGKDNEEKAKIQYKNYTKILGFEIKDTGLWINSNFVGLGASPDALVFDPIENSCGVLEIKCPKLLENLKNQLKFTN